MSLKEWLTKLAYMYYNKTRGLLDYLSLLHSRCDTFKLARPGWCQEKIKGCIDTKPIASQTQLCAFSGVEAVRARFIFKTHRGKTQQKTLFTTFEPIHGLSWVLWKAREKRRENCRRAAVHSKNARHIATIWLVESCLARNSNLFRCTSVCSSLRSFVRTAARLETCLLSLKNTWFIHRMEFPNPWLICGGTRAFFPTWQEQLMIPFH